MQQAHGIPSKNVLAGWESLVAIGQKVADFAVIATQDRYVWKAITNGVCVCACVRVCVG